MTTEQHLIAAEHHLGLAWNNLTLKNLRNARMPTMTERLFELLDSCNDFARLIALRIDKNRIIGAQKKG